MKRLLRLGLLCTLLTPPNANASRNVESMLNETVRIETKSGRGAGVLISADGAILTASHLFKSTTEIPETMIIETRDGTKYTGSVVAIDRKNDLALVRVDQSVTGLSYAHLAERSPSQGDDIWIVGHPFGLAWTVTRGVVSGVDRFDTNKLQSDAVANPGNSGGPMFNSRGEIVGILTNGFPLPFYIGQVFGVTLRVCRNFIHKSSVPL